MLDFNHRGTVADHLNQRIDVALTAERATTPPRSYLGASRLGAPCDRALQFEFTDTPVDAGSTFSGPACAQPTGDTDTDRLMAKAARQANDMETRTL